MLLISLLFFSNAVISNKDKSILYLKAIILNKDESILLYNCSKGFNIWMFFPNHNIAIICRNTGYVF